MNQQHFLQVCACIFGSAWTLPENKMVSGLLLPVRQVMQYVHAMQAFNYFITAIIVINIVGLATTVYGESASFSAAKEKCNYAFTVIFFFEAAIKVTGLGWRNYWHNGWNKFDFFLVAMAIVDIGFTQIAAQGSSVSPCTAVLSCSTTLCTPSTHDTVLQSLTLVAVMYQLQKGCQFFFLLLLSKSVVCLPDGMCKTGTLSKV